VLRDVSSLKKDPRSVLERYLRHPASDVVLLLIDPAGEKLDRALADAAFVVEFTPLAADRVPAWIAHHAETNLKVKVTEEAARVLLAAVGPELAGLAAELDKLSSYTGGGTIDENTVRAVVGMKSGETLTDLLDAVALRDASRAASLVPIVLAQPKANAVTVIMALATQMTAIAWGRASRDRGVPPAGVDRGFYTLLKDGKAFPGRPWKEAVSCWLNGTQRWTTPELEHALHELLAADTAAKEARVSSDEQLITSLVLALCAGRGRRAA
jgi:DNA polymerase-3 subunit delta